MAQMDAPGVMTGKLASARHRDARDATPVAGRNHGRDWCKSTARLEYLLRGAKVRGPGLELNYHLTPSRRPRQTEALLCGEAPQVCHLPRRTACHPPTSRSPKPRSI